jgi:hypothetical protein
MTDRIDYTDVLTHLADVAWSAWNDRPQGGWTYAEKGAYHTATGARLAEAAQAVLDHPDADRVPEDVREAALRAYADVLRWMRETGCAPSSFAWETFLLNPAQSTEHVAGPYWHLCYESGPGYWSEGFEVVPERLHTGAWGYTETYWGFDLIFVRG